jgi:antagonist of KipI
MRVTVTRPGFLTSVQDLGRARFRRFGVSVGGALDQHALRVSNLLVGNEEFAAGLEVTIGGLRLVFSDERLIAWCGGAFKVSVGATELLAGRAAVIAAGEELTMNQSTTGCRVWLAISGGIDVPPILESRSTDLRANFGGLEGRALRDGDMISITENSRRSKMSIDRLREAKVAHVSALQTWASPGQGNPALRIVRGAHWDLFDAEYRHLLTDGQFIVSADSDRMGARLDGPTLKRNDSSDLVSEAVAPGTIQVPPNGKPIVLLGDCQTIGGYPKIAHVITVDFPIAAQLRAGDRVGFREVSLVDAHRLLSEREQDLEKFRVGIGLQMQ